MVASRFSSSSEPMMDLHTLVLPDAVPPATPIMKGAWLGDPFARGEELGRSSA
jgi:hypothetical protein